MMRYQAMNEQALFSSNKQDWETPQKLFDELDKEFGFELDAMATKENALCKAYFTAEDDSLIQDWSKYQSIYINPPYKTSIQNKVLEKAYKTHTQSGNTIVLLIPARTDTKRWHDFIFGKAEVRFLQGRIKFCTNGIEHINPAPFPSALIIYRATEEIK